MENADLTWISQKMFSYQDPETTTTLDVFLDSGIIEEDSRNRYCSPRILFQMKDYRFQNSKTQIELQFSEMSFLVDKIKILIDTGLKNAFGKPNTSIVVTRFAYKTKKDLCFSFNITQNNTPYVQLEISDPTSKGNTRAVMFLDVLIFIQLYKFCSQIRDNYSMLSVSFLTALLQEKVLDEIRLLQSIKPVIAPVSKYLVDVDTESVNPEDTNTEATRHFNTIGNGLFNSELDIVKENIQESNNTIKIEETPMPFIGKFLDYDPKKLNEWVSAFLCSNEQSDDTIFCPLSKIINTCLRECKFDTNNSTFLKIQYFLDVMFKRSTLNYLGPRGKFFSYPVFKLPNNNLFRPGTEIYTLSEEILFCFIIYTNLYECYMKYLNNDVSNQKYINEILLVQNFLKSYLSFFFVSMSYDNVNMIKEDILSIMDKCSRNGYLSRLNSYYSEISKGGSLDFSNKMMSPYIDLVLEELVNSPINTFGPSDIENVFRINQISECGQIKDSSEVKKFVISLLNMEKPNVIDNRLVLFLNCIKKYCDPITLKQMESKCKKYSDLTEYFRENNLADEIIKIKRIMDREPQLVHKSDILKLANSLEEDVSVSETRVLFNENIEYGNQQFDAERELLEVEGD